MAGSTTEGEFSFPIITETHPSSIDSPPLWHLSPAASPNHNSSYNKLSNEEYCKQRKSCSNIDTYHYKTEGDQEENKMDILWEDYFNEEVSTMEAIKSSGGDHSVELGRVRALKLCKNWNGAIFSAAKKPSIVVFMKVLKKLFLLNNNSHHRRPRSVKNNKAW
ncbi:hypothetical protein AB3S75_011399 [Citrus x aurantiifolia]